MADLPRIKSNVAKMASVNAPEADIDGYIASEGVSLDDVRNFQPATPNQAPQMAAIGNGGTSDPNDPFFQGLALPGQQQPPGAPPVNTVPPSQHFGMGSSDTLNPIPALSTAGDELAGSIPIAGPTLRNMGENFDAFVDNNLYRPMQGLKGITTQAEVAKSNAQGRNLNPEASVAGELAGSVLPFMAAGGIPLAAKGLGLAGTTMERLGYGLGSQYGINTADQMTHGKSIPDALKEAMLPTAIAAPFLMFGGGKTTLPKQAPSVQELKDEAGKIYDQARASGVRMPQSGTIALSDNMYQVARDAGIVSPTGQIAKGYGKVNDVIDHLDQYSHGEMTVPQMQATRKLLQDAAGSIDKGERRVGTQMLKAFDRTVAQGVPQLAEAAPIYHRAMKGETIDKAIGSAGVKASQFSQSGSENALRTTFRQLDNKLESGKLRGFSEAEKQAVQAVSRGTPVVNGLRNLGKFAPKGPISAGASILGPLAAGAAMGQPTLGALASVLMAGAGAAAHTAAGRMQAGNAQIASALARRGAPAPEVARRGAIARPEINALARVLIGQMFQPQTGGGGGY